jgi:hypothetical protein
VRAAHSQPGLAVHAVPFAVYPVPRESEVEKRRCLETLRATEAPSNVERQRLSATCTCTVHAAPGTDSKDQDRGGLQKEVCKKPLGIVGRSNINIYWCVKTEAVCKRGLQKTARHRKT